MWQNRLFWRNHERTNVSVPKKTKTGEWERDSGGFFYKWEVYTRERAAESQNKIKPKR
jgi:hypothetical protein